MNAETAEHYWCPYLSPTHPLPHHCCPSCLGCLFLSPPQVLDARDPAGCRCPDVERYVRSLDPNKRIILLLNKMGEWGRGAVGCVCVCVWGGGRRAATLCCRLCGYC